jgi:hypothetical protein
MLKQGKVEGKEQYKVNGIAFVNEYFVPCFSYGAFLFERLTAKLWDDRMGVLIKMI